MYLDIGAEMRTGGAFATKLRQLAQEFEQLSKRSLENPAYASKANEILHRIVTHCQYNLFFFVGYYFPKYFNGHPLTFKDFPFASTVFNYSIGGFTVYRGSRQISKSTALSVRHILLCNLLPGYKVMYITPRTDQLRTYANRLRETERAFRYFKGISNKDQRSNLGFKEFGEGAVRSTIELMHVLTEASNVRGKSATELDIDECQDFDPDLETEVSQVNSATNTPITIYSGTSTTTETFLEAKFQESSMGYWSIKCDCGHTNIPLPEFNVLDMIQPKGPSCVKCRRLLNVMQGEYVHMHPERIKLHRIGFHMPQIVVPFVVNNAARWQQIVDRKMSGVNMIKFNQELLGIPSEEGARELTRRQLEDICTLGDKRGLQRKAINKGYAYVVSGCDWGGTEFSVADKLKVSTTVHAMLGVLPAGDLNLIHMKRYLGMDFESQAEDIMRNHNALKGDAIASDAGVGMAYNREIRRYTLPEKHLILGYVGPHSAYLDTPGTAHDINQWSLNKTESLTILFQAIKSARIRCYTWEDAQAYLQDFLAMFRAMSEAPGGASTFTYRNSATKPSDTAHAINFAFTLAKLLIGENVFSDSAVRNRVVAGLKGQYSIQPGRRVMRPISG